MTSPWRPIAEAPRDGTEIVVWTRRGSVVLARWYNELSAWVAVYEDEHPPSWTDGVCWEVNADGEPSDPPELWVPLP